MLSSQFNFTTLSKAQQVDPELTELRASSSSSSLVFQDCPLPLTTGTLVCDTSTGSPRPYVPSAYICQIFDQLNSIAHPGICATTYPVTQLYVWPDINKDVHTRARSCLQCQKAEIHHHTKAPFGTFDDPNARFDQIHIDTVGLLPLSNYCRGVVGGWQGGTCPP